MKARDASRNAQEAPCNAIDELRMLEEELAVWDELGREVSAALDALATPQGAIAPALPRPAARDALLSALSSGERFRPFLADLVRWCDLPAARVRDLLSQIDEAGAWMPGPLPGLAFMPFSAGPKAIAHDAGFARVPRGLYFPYHRHAGHEINYVLAGAVRDGDGTLYLPGEAMVKAPGSAHECYVLEDADALVAIVYSGFEFIEKP